MNPVLEKLGKILSLEEQTGLQNQAVIGGLDKLATHWIQDAAAEFPAPNQQAFVRQVGDLLNVYPARSTSEGRLETINAIRKLLDRLESTAGKPPTQAEAAEPQRQTMLPSGSKICIRLFPESATKTLPESSRPIPYGACNCPSPEPVLPNFRTYVPAEVNTWMRSFPESAT